MAKRLALSTSDHLVPGSNPTGARIQPMSVKGVIAQSLSKYISYNLDTVSSGSYELLVPGQVN